MSVASALRVVEEALAALRAEIEARDPHSPRRPVKSGKWDDATKHALLDGLDEVERGKITLTKLAREHGVSISGLSRFAHRKGYALLPTGRAAGRNSCPTARREQG
jgi:hypothetical protein